MATREELLVLLQRFTIETDRYVEAVGERNGLYRTDLAALNIMIGAARAGVVVTPGLLREELNLSSPATTALVDRLGSAGHVTRRRSEVDRRQVHLEMTEKARTTGALLFAPLARHISGVFDQYSEEQLALLQDMMRKVADATAAAKNEARDDVGAD